VSSSAETDDAETHTLISNLAFTSNSGDNAATSATYISDLDQWSTALGAGSTGTILFSGIKEDGTAFANQPITWTGAAAGTGDTMQSILDQITALYDDSTAILNADGKIVITANSPGYNLAQVTGMSYAAAAGDALTVPTYFDYTKIGGNDDKDFKITIFDNMGEQHVLSGTFVKTDVTNTWDLVINSITGERAGEELNLIPTVLSRDLTL
jgi:hypothetical protein